MGGDWNGDGKVHRSHSVVFYGDQIGIDSSSDGNDVFSYSGTITDLTVYGGGGSDQLGGGRSWDNLMASSMLLDGGSGDDLVTGSNRYSDVRSKYTLSQYQANAVCPVHLPNTR